MKRLSGYRLMWMMVLYDLPVVEEHDRHEASKFHRFLLNEGFYMAQYSVYMKHAGSQAAIDAQKKHITKNLPNSNGHVNVLVFTDKQYENIECFLSHKKLPALKNPEQLVLL